VKNISDGVQFKYFAIDFLEFSITTFEFRPWKWIEEGFA
jgi:hypothetical protein